MDDKIRLISNKTRHLFKKKINIFYLIILVLILPLTVFVSEQQQNTSQFASGTSTITFFDANGIAITQTDSPSVHVQLNAPWPIAMASTKNVAEKNDQRVVAGTSAFVIYGDALAQGWSNGSYDSSINYKNISPVYSGTYSISDQPTKGWGGLEMNAPSNGFSTTPYTHIQFYVHATGKNENFGIYLDNTLFKKLANTILLSNYGGFPSTTGWTLYTIPLSALNGANQTIGDVTIQNSSSKTQPTIYVDQVQFVNLSAPTNTPIPTVIPTYTPIPLPTSTPTPLYTSSALVSDDPNFATNTVTINPYNQNPYQLSFTFSDATPGTKTLYVKFVATDGTVQTYSHTIQLVSPTVNPTPTPISSSGKNWYISKSGNNTIGDSWTNAWTDTTTINWNTVKPGDTLIIDGGTSTCSVSPYDFQPSSPNPGVTCGQRYSAFTIGQNNITIERATTQGQNGTVTIDGGRDTPLPYCEQSSYSTPNGAAIGIDFANYLGVTIDGMSRSGIIIRGTQNGVRMGSGSGNTLRNIELFDNGYPTTHSFGYNSDGNNILMGGQNNTYDRLLIHDGGQDQFHSDSSGYSEAGSKIINSWMGAMRENPLFPGEPFNDIQASGSNPGCTHADGIQIFAPGTTMSGLTIDHDVFGPGVNQGVYPSDSGTGTTFNNVTVTNTLFLDVASHNIITD